MPKFFGGSGGNHLGSTGRMRVIVNTSADAVDIFLHGIVGEKDDSCDAKSLAEILAKHPGKPVTLRINSPGGSFYDGLALANALRRHDGETKAIVDGLCASAATVVAVGCDEISMHKNSSWHVHQAIVGSIGHQADLQDALTWLQACDKHLEEVYATRTGRPLKEVRAAMLGKSGDGTHYDASEALAFGFVDVVIQSDGFSKTKRRASARRIIPTAAEKQLMSLQDRMTAAKRAHAKFGSTLTACGR